MDSATGWRGRLSLHAWRDGAHTRVHSAHSGPLRSLKALYPEGPGICHQVVVHPPGGVVGGDTLELDVQLAPHSHVLVTTPGATRWYRTDQRPAHQQARLKLAEGARLEWLLAENIAHPGCLAHNSVTLDLAPGAEAMLAEVLVLGLPASNQPWAQDASGVFETTLHWPGHWLERGVLRAADALLLKSPLGLAGHTVLGTLALLCAPAVESSGAADSAASAAPALAMQRSRRQQALLEVARELLAAPVHSRVQAGATSPNDHVVLLRVLGQQAESVQALLRAVWALWRPLAWGVPARALRLWGC